MSTQQDKLREIADAIRSKDGTTEPIIANDFAERIRKLNVLPPIGKKLDEYTWDEISQISQLGLGASYFKVGDCKAITLNGTVGTKIYDNVTLYVYILGFNHNAELEGEHLIHFGGFKTAAMGGIDVALDDASYNSYDTSGKLLYNMNHWGNYNYGGWAACDMRYDILGSTNQPPAGYGIARTVGCNGNDPTATCATSPVANTLMAALPIDLRAVMRPITKYSDNVGNKNASAGAITATKDYLPLMDEFEVHGTRTHANDNLKSKQAQYAYYAASNSKIKYRQSATGTTLYYWNRSPYYNNTASFCIVTSNGSAAYDSTRGSYGISSIFAV